MKIKLKFNYESLSQEQKSLVSYFTNDANVYLYGSYDDSSGELSYLSGFTQTSTDVVCFGNASPATEVSYLDVIEYSLIVPYGKLNSNIAVSYTDITVPDIYTTLLGYNSSLYMYKYTTVTDTDGSNERINVSVNSVVVPDVNVVSVIGNVENNDISCIPTDISYSSRLKSVKLESSYNKSDEIYQFKTDTFRFVLDINTDNDTIQEAIEVLYKVFVIANDSTKQQTLINKLRAYKLSFGDEEIKVNDSVQTLVYYISDSNNESVGYGKFSVKSESGLYNIATNSFLPVMIDGIDGICYIKLYIHHNDGDSEFDLDRSTFSYIGVQEYNQNTGEWITPITRYEDFYDLNIIRLQLKLINP